MTSQDGAYQADRLRERESSPGPERCQLESDAEGWRIVTVFRKPGGCNEAGQSGTTKAFGERRRVPWLSPTIGAGPRTGSRTLSLNEAVRERTRRVFVLLNNLIEGFDRLRAFAH